MEPMNSDLPKSDPTRAADARPPAGALSGRTVHVIERNQEELLFLCDFLSIPGLRVTGSSHPELAPGYLARTRPEVVVIDRGAVPGDAVRYLEQLRQASPTTRLLLTTAQTTPALAKEVRRRRGDDILLRPFTVIELLRTVERILWMETPCA